MLKKKNKTVAYITRTAEGEDKCFEITGPIKLTTRKRLEALRDVVIEAIEKGAYEDES